MRAAHQAVSGGSGPPPPGVSLVRPGGLCVHILALGPWRATANGRPTLKQKGGEAWSPGLLPHCPPFSRWGTEASSCPFTQRPVTELMTRLALQTLGRNQEFLQTPRDERASSQRPRATKRSNRCPHLKENHFDPEMKTQPLSKRGMLGDSSGDPNSRG